jgi:hypothetical protein
MRKRAPKRTMARSLACTHVRVDGPSGRVTLRFSDGAILEFRSRADVRSYVRDLLDEMDVDTLRRLLLAWWLANNPDPPPAAALTNATLTVNLTSNTLIAVT